MAMKDYSDEFKADAVALYESPPGTTYKSIAADLGVNRATLRAWVLRDRERRGVTAAAASPAARPREAMPSADPDERVRIEMPFLAGVVTFYENNQAEGRGLEGGPEDGVSMLQPPTGPDPLPSVNEAAMSKARMATEALVHQGKVSGAVGAMVIPAKRGVLVAVGGVDGELYVNGMALTEQWAAQLRANLRDIASDVVKLQARRAEWQDAPPAGRSFEMGGCTDPNCHGVH